MDTTRDMIPNTLGSWHIICLATFGEFSAATKFIERKKKESRANNDTSLRIEPILFFETLREIDRTERELLNLHTAIKGENNQHGN